MASTKQVDRKLLRNTVKDLKDKILSGEVKSMSWLSTKNMISDVLTKEKKMPDELKDLLLSNRFALSGEEINLVQAVDGELRMFNIRNRNDDKNV